VYWQGPSLGWDFGGDGARTMMLVYRLPATTAIYERFGGISGSSPASSPTPRTVKGSFMHRPAVCRDHAVDNVFGEFVK
jgi:hypothetical protein